MITPQKIQELSEPVESIYTACVNELMVNIGKHITAPTWTHTAAWEVQKLSEMGQLTQENAAIINKWIKQVTPEMRRTMEFTRREALKKLEKQMEKAAEEGYVTPPLADSTVQVMNDYLGQATDRLNLVNTTMLQSSISQYSKAVNLTADIMARENATLTALNVAAGSVVTGTETRTKAVRRAIDTISKEGITGFYDRSGRSWTPEAYVNMVVRTTVHNTAIQSVKSRMQDYGTDVFQISSHAGARPRCYPYQGWFCSWSNTSGDIELGDGRTVRYRPLSDTSYGEPAGIFGINCGHYPIPIIAGLTIPHGEDNIQPKEENDKAYAESQQQRALERQIRAAKRTIEMGDNSPEAKQKLKEQQQKMRQFIKETGRTRRYDRESLMGGAQTSQKLKQNAQPATPQNVNSQLTTSAPKNVSIGSKISSSLGSNAAEYEKLVNQNPNVAATYDAYAGTLNSVTQLNGGGVYKRGSKSIEWDYGTSTAKYGTLAHEFGHHVDAQFDKSKFTTKETDALNNAVGNIWSPFKRTASGSDEFLTAMRQDRANLSKYVTSKADRKTMHDELLASRNTTAGIQDAFDGFWGTQDSKDSSFNLPWGHGNSYYNRTYNAIKRFGKEKALQQAYKGLGLDASNQDKTKKLTRDYDTASELWANIQSAETVGGDELKYMKKYFPNAVQVWENLTGSL